MPIMIFFVLTCTTIKKLESSPIQTQAPTNTHNLFSIVLSLIKETLHFKVFFGETCVPIFLQMSPKKFLTFMGNQCFDDK